VTAINPIRHAEFQHLNEDALISYDLSCRKRAIMLPTCEKLAAKLFLRGPDPNEHTVFQPLGGEAL
jgi:hypothetical protein